MRKLAIIVGHTDKAKGASMIPPYDFVQEYEYNTLLAAHIKMLSKELTDFEVKIFFRDDRGIELTYQDVDSWNPGAAIEIHFNAFEGTANGCLTLFGSQPEANLFAHLVHEEVRRVMQNRDRGTKFTQKPDRGWRSLTGGSYPKILVEPFFGTNLADCERALLRMDRLAHALVRGSLKYFAL